MDTSTHPPRRPLNSIPADIINLIASHADENTIWALKAVCRGWREPSERALQPYLKEKKVVFGSGLMVDRYHAIDRLSSIDYTARKKQLRAHSNKFERHLNAYPSSGTLLERLTMEIRDDDAYAGWPQLAHLALRLRHLELHIFDRFYQQLDHAGGAELRRVNNQNRFNWSQLALSPLRLPLLTSLVIHSTTRALHHFSHIASFLVSLRSLTLGEHWADESSSPTWYLRPFGKLEHLTVIGTDYWVLEVLKPLLPCAPILRCLTVHRKHREDPVISQYLNEGIKAISAAKSLRSLAVYGQRTDLVLRTIILRQNSLSDKSFDKLASLSLELTHAGGSLPADPLSAWVGPHLMSVMRYADQQLANEDVMIALPKLGHASCVIRPTPGICAPSYSAPALRSIFSQFPSLRQASCVSEYPIDPSLPVDRTDPSVITFVERDNA